MKEIRVTIQIEPLAKSRPRTVFKDGKVRTYTPTKTVEVQESIRARLLKHINQAFPPHIPIRLSATFFRTKSKYLPLRETKPFRKPDLTNFTQLLADSLSGILIGDDAQITTLRVAKRWSDKDYGYITLKLEEDNDNL